eukprot:CAMPEP_0113605958 /NCGR_PEP_ID=MMETSP0017_2-20120614/2603_1 /TAXON_ID=2856 /ORGANISM="Cylindrotheca closterium" /LENGTH=325 /DNA_ID=CAMNT_0000514479 /DNA_START=33 /DNA_END=1009 /DNA_ORIENTATION=- /assembly_acc=CAM_ASM_000147
MVRPDDKLEVSPTGRATCRICKTKIAKGSVRAGIHYLYEGTNWYCKYYHKDCLKTTSQGISLWKKAKLPPEMLLKQKGGNDLSRMNLLDLGVSKIEKKKRVSDSTIRERKVLRETLELGFNISTKEQIGIANIITQIALKTTSIGISIWKKAKLPPELLLKQKGGNDLSRMNLLDLGVSKIEKKKRVSDSTIRERTDLRERLRQLRLIIARRLDYPPYCVFHDTTLDALVLQLPSTKAELLKISGFGLKKTATLGPCILPIIQGYKRKQLTSPTTRTNSKSSSSNYGAVPSLDDEEIEVVGEVSNEQLIDQVFEEAEKLGNVISL